MRRISSARLLQELPEIRTDLQSGDLNLTQVSMLAQAVRQFKPGMSVKDLLVHLAEEVVRKKDPAREVRKRRSRDYEQTNQKVTKKELVQNLVQASNSSMGSSDTPGSSQEGSKNHTVAVLTGVKNAGDPIRSSAKSRRFFEYAILQPI